MRSRNGICERGPAFNQVLVLGAGREILSSTYRRHFFSRGGKSKRPRARAEKYDEDRGTWTHDGENENR